jgi:hypothetical protein
MARRAGWLGIGMVIGLLGAGCESQPPAGAQRPQSRPTAGKPVAPTPEPPGAAVAEPAEPAAPAEPELPNYLTLVARIDARQPARAEVLGAAEQRLAVNTHNVKRLRIERGRLPFRKDRSIALILDGQGIEWRADSKVVEFERSPNGAWMPVKPD